MVRIAKFRAGCSRTRPIPFDALNGAIIRNASDATSWMWIDDSVAGAGQKQPRPESARRARGRTAGPNRVDAEREKQTDGYREESRIRCVGQAELMDARLQVAHSILILNEDIVNSHVIIIQSAAHRILNAEL